VDGQGLPLSRAHGRPDRPRSHAGAAPRGLQLRHHLLHEQRAGLRLPPRQHGHLQAGDGPARTQLRHRRRGRLHPHRRGPHPAHYLRPRRGVVQPLRDGRFLRLEVQEAGLCRHRRQGAAGPVRLRLHRG